MTSLALSPRAHPHFSQGQNQELWTETNTYKETELEAEDSVDENGVRSKEVRVKNGQYTSILIPVACPEFKRDLLQELIKHGVIGKVRIQDI